MDAPAEAEGIVEMVRLIIDTSGTMRAARGDWKAYMGVTHEAKRHESHFMRCSLQTHAEIVQKPKMGTRVR
jgi:hypothetical protein